MENLVERFELFKKWWKEIPLFVMSLFYFTLFLYIFAGFSPYHFIIYILYPFQVITNFNIWGIFTFQYFNYWTSSYLLQIILYFPSACKTEQEMSTVTYFFFFIINNIILAILYVVLIGLHSVTDSDLFGFTYYIPMYGLFPIFMVEIVIRYNKSPNTLTRFCMVPYEFRQKFHPWIYVFIFTYLFNFMCYKFLVGIIVGYLRKIYLDVWGVLKFTVFSEQASQKLQGFCGFLTRFQRFIPVIRESASERVEIGEFLPNMDNIVPVLYKKIN